MEKMEWRRNKHALNSMGKWAGSQEASVWDSSSENVVGAQN